FLLLLLRALRALRGDRQSAMRTDARGETLAARGGAWAECSVGARRMTFRTRGRDPEELHHEEHEAHEGSIPRRGIAFGGSSFWGVRQECLTYCWRPMVSPVDG